MATIIDLLMDIYIHIKNSVIKQYFSICGIIPENFLDPNTLHEEINKFGASCVDHPSIVTEMCKFIGSVGRESKLDFLKKFSSEQSAYITNLDLTDTKLLACAGSGKTRSIIGRIKFLVDHQLTSKETVFVITFSKFAAIDFHKKIKNLFPDFETFAQLKNFSTIDSLAKSILCKMKPHKSDNVEILSIAFRNYLKNISTEDMRIIKKMKHIKHLFVDEAQDLNQIQFDIIMLIKKNFGSIVHLVGDPNQNIFQFRGSNNSHLLDLAAKKYFLSINFRSTQQIIDFGQNLMPVRSIKPIKSFDSTGCKVCLLSKPAKEIHDFILKFIRTYNADLSNIAICCPTRGIGNFDTVGLSVFFNLFKVNKIPFKQLYNEAGATDQRKRDVDVSPGHINLLTWHGTKGLEFDVVFVMDMYQHLFNIQPTELEHQNHLYLLYVATTRAKKQMFCCAYTNMYAGCFNHWVANIDPNTYVADKVPVGKLSFRSQTDSKQVNGITDIIEELSDADLDQISDLIKISEQFDNRIYKDYTHIDRNGDECLFGIFLEELFYLQYNLLRNIHPKKLKLVEMIIKSNFIIVDNISECNLLKNFIMKNQMTWAIYDQISFSVRPDIKSLINKYFTREAELNSCVVCTNEFIRVININLKYISRAYQKYLSAELYTYDYKKILDDFFYLTVVQYAYNNNHYCYIDYADKSKVQLLDSGKSLFQTMNEYVEFKYVYSGINIESKVNVSYSKLMLLGEIDYMELYPTGAEIIVDIKCAASISMKYLIQVVLYNFCRYWKTNPTNIYCNYFKILNLLTGIEHTIIFKISPCDMFDILNIFAKKGNLKFSNMTLVYDLETTNKISFHGPLNYKPTVNRGRVWLNNQKFYAETYPEIIEIAMKDYDTSMTIIDRLVRPVGSVHPEVERLTGIWNRMLTSNIPNISAIRSILNLKLENFINSRLLAHNGKCFDDKIISFDKLVDPSKFIFLDTMSVIPIHMPTRIKLKRKSVTAIYTQLFMKDFVAHRAMADVNALIQIMKHLKIEF